MNTVPLDGIVQLGALTEQLSIGWHEMSAGGRESLAVFGALALVTLLSVGAILAFRKRPRLDLSGHPIASSSSGSKHRRRRREHRRRNPTRAETGGLPSVRSDKNSGLAP
jgi:hypothetical protein